MRHLRSNQRSIDHFFHIQGLTLIELLVAMVIMAVVSVGSYTLFELVQTAKERLGAHSTRLSDLQRGFNWLSKDISAAIDRPVRDQFGSYQNALIGTSDSLEFTRNSVISLDLNKFSEEDDNEREENTVRKSELLRVQYQLEENNLRRAYWPSLDRSDSDEAFSSEIMSNLSQVEFRYFAKDENSGGRWYPAWPPESIGGLVALQDPDADPDSEDDAEDKKRRLLPQIIEINLETETYGKVTKLIELSSFQLPTDQLEAGQSPEADPDGEGNPDEEGGNQDDEVLNDGGDEEEDFG